MTYHSFVRLTATLVGIVLLFLLGFAASLVMRGVEPETARALALVATFLLEIFPLAVVVRPYVTALV